MVDKNDWRLSGQENYLKDKTLYFRKWAPPKENWDHDHCEFCWATISNYACDLQEAYTTEDNYHWICPECFQDFKDLFGWKIGEEKT